MSDATPVPYAATVHDMPGDFAVVVHQPDVPHMWYQAASGQPGFLEVHVFDVAHDGDEKIMFCDFDQGMHSDWHAAFPIIMGDVKWDGCFNWTVNPRCMAHACDAENLAQQLAALHKGYTVAMEAIVPPSFR